MVTIASGIHCEVAETLAQWALTFYELWIPLSVCGERNTNHASVRELLTIREFYALRVKLMRGCKMITSPNVSRGRREILSFTGKSPELECMDQWMQTKSKSEKRYKDSESCAIDHTIHL